MAISTTPKTPLTPQWSNTPLDANGIFSRVWYLYFDSMTKAVAAATGSPPSTGITVASPPIWLPNYERPVAGDPLFGVNGFGIAQSYAPTADGSALATLNVYGYPPPDPFGLVFKVRRELVSGIFAQVAADVVTVDGSHGTISFGGSGGIADQFVGRIMSKLANPAGSIGSLIGIRDFTVTGNDTSGNFTVTPDPAVVGCASGDLFTLRTGGPGVGSPPVVTTPLTADATSVTDALFVNLYNPGLTTPNANRANLLLVIGGKGAFQTAQTVVANTGTKITIAPGWDVVPDATSIIVLVEAIPQVVLSADLTAIADPLVGSLPIDNYSGKVVRVEGYTSHGMTGPIETVPFREVYIWGSGGTRTVTDTGTTAQRIVDGTLLHDTTAGSQTLQLLPSSAIPNRPLLVRRATTDAYTVTIKTDPGDVFPDGTTSMVLAGNSQVLLKFPGTGNVVIPVASSGGYSAGGYDLVPLVPLV